MQIDDLLHKLDSKEGDLSRILEEKDQELMILQEGMDTTLQQMNELQLVSRLTPNGCPTYLVSSDILGFSR